LGRDRGDVEAWLKGEGYLEKGKGEGEGKGAGRL